MGRKKFAVENRMRTTARTFDSSSTQLELNLFGQGMGLFHRAGLAGLVSTLLWIDRNVSASEKPPGDWIVNERCLTIRMMHPETFLKILYSLAFQTRDGLFFMPGKFPLRTPPREVLVFLHRAMTSTFYFHKPSTCGKMVQLRKQEIQIDDDYITLVFPEWSKFKHQEMYRDLLSKGRLTDRPVSFKAGVCPGAIERHAAYGGETSAEDSAANVLCLHFALVACLCLLGRKHDEGIIVVPEIDDLRSAATIIQAMVPRNASECHVGGASDAAFQAELRLRLNLQISGGIPSCVGMTTSKKAWNAVCRNSVVFANPESKNLDFYQGLLDDLPTRIIGSNKPSKNGSTHFWMPSACRALFSHNLAKGHRWYEDFYKRFRSNELSKETLFERRGLQIMVHRMEWDDPSERTLVMSVHEALRRRFGAIAGENERNPVAMKNRLQRERDRLRIALAKAKTQADFRHTIADLWSRAGTIQELQSNWPDVLSFLSKNRWQHGRDLALLALASYKGKSKEETEALNQTEGLEEDMK